MKKESSNKIIFYNMLSTIILYAIAFFSSPVFSRVLGVHQYGLVQVYNTWHAFFAIIIGLMTRGVLPMARIQYAEELQESFQSCALGLSITAFLTISVITLLFQRYIVPLFGLNLKFLVVLLVHSFGTFCVLFLNAKFTYEMRASNNMLLSVFLALTTFGLSFALIQRVEADARYAARILGMAIPYILAGIGTVIYIFRQGKLFYHAEYWKFIIPLCLPLIFHSISGMVCSSGDRIMIQKMMSVSAVGIYTLSYNFANVMDSIWVSLNNSWTPFMVDYIKENQYELLRKRSRNYTRIFTCLCIGFILLTPEVFRIYADESYWSGAAIIPIIVMSQFAVFIYAFASNYEFCFLRTDFIAVGSVIAGVCNVVLNLVLIPIWGYMGAAITTLLANIILFLCHARFAKKLAKEKWIYSAGMFIPSVLCLAIATVIYYIFYEVWLVRWLLAIAVGIYMLFDVYNRKSIF